MYNQFPRHITDVTTRVLHSGMIAPAFHDVVVLEMKQFLVTVRFWGNGFNFGDCLLSHARVELPWTGQKALFSSFLQFPASAGVMLLES